MPLPDFLPRNKKVHAPGFELLFARGMNELQLRTASHCSLFGIDRAAWNVDRDAGTIAFSTPEMIATCPVQFVGTMNTEDETWLWAWANSSLEPALTQHSKRLKAYGEQHGIELLTIRKFPCTEQLAWEFTAIMCKHCESQGAYRGPADPALVFMTFGEIKLSKAK